MPVAERPSLVVDDVHIHYRTFGGRRPTGPSWLGKVRRHVGAVDVVKAVRGVSFVASHGESIGVIGHNGTGKSTLLRAIAGGLPTASGAIWADGSTALLGVNAALMRDLSGHRNITLGGLALGLTPAQIAERHDELVELAGIGDFLHLPMRAYSSGMSARLRFAISSAARPDLPEFKQRSRERIDEIVGTAGTVILVSHSMSTIRSMCDRVLWLDHGRLVADGPTAEVLEEYSERTGRPTARPTPRRTQEVS
jgi:teichoic acid transport system ATP-binding protein